MTEESELEKALRIQRESEQAMLHAEAVRKTDILAIGDQIAKQQGYKTLRGMDAVVRYLVDKHHWLPADIRRLTANELALLLDIQPIPTIF